MNVALATAADDLQIRALLRDEPMPGWVQLAYEREPSFFSAAATLGDTQAIVLRDGDAVLGLGCRSSRRLYLDGEPRRVGYLSGLRTHPSIRGRSCLARGYKLLRCLEDADPLPGYVSTILENNHAALDLLTSGRAGLPRYCDIGRYTVAAVPLGWIRPSRRISRELNVTRGSAPALREIIAFLNEQGKRRQFFPVIGEQDIGTALWRCLRAEDFLVARTSSGGIAGVMACWDQSKFKQARVRNYSPWLRHTRGVLNMILRTAGLPGLARPGEAVRIAYAALTCIRDDRVEVFGTLLDAASSAAARAGTEILCCGFHERDPLREAIRPWRAMRYSSRVFWVTWADGPPPVDKTTVPHLEAALL